MYAIARALKFEWHGWIQKSWVQRGFKFADELNYPTFSKIIHENEIIWTQREIRAPCTHPNHMDPSLT